MRVQVTDTKDAKAKVKAAKLLGLRAELLAFGDWRCSDDEIMFCGSGVPVEVGRAGSLHATNPDDNSTVVLVEALRLAKLVLEIRTTQ